MSDAKSRRVMATNSPVSNGKSANHGSFAIVDNFRRWGASKGLSSSAIEEHIRRAAGKGYDHLYAMLQVVKQSYEPKPDIDIQ